VLVDVRKDELADGAAKIASTRVEAMASCTDIANPESLRALFSETKARFGRLDILHNNSVLVEGNPDWLGIALGRSAAIIAVNLPGEVLRTPLALDPMKESGGA
jgi:NAD(P)-dependent dehydrogenase (short-subunit alcohol dehydrogenase family)